MQSDLVITTERLRLVAFSRESLQALLAGEMSFTVDGVAFRFDPNDRDTTPLLHLAKVHLTRMVQSNSRPWLVRAFVDAEGRMTGHGGYHDVPRSVEQALEDPTFEGNIDPASGPAAEIGYSIFPQYRRQGFASEAATSLVSWAFRTQGLGAVIATVRPANTASQKVLYRSGAFRQIGTCRDDDENHSLELVLRCDNPQPPGSI